jgi:hypothetical protein
MTSKPLVGAVALLAIASLYVPAPAESTTVPRTVLVEEFGWAS